MRPWIKLAIEAGPLVVFFIVNGRDGLPAFRHLWLAEGVDPMAEQGLFEATAAFMVATLIALAAGWVLERRLPVMPLVSGIFVLFFGGLTLVLADETFIKLKPTIVNALFAATTVESARGRLEAIPRARVLDILDAHGARSGPGGGR